MHGLSIGASRTGKTTSVSQRFSELDCAQLVFLGRPDNPPRFYSYRAPGSRIAEDNLGDTEKVLSLEVMPKRVPEEEWELRRDQFIEMLNALQDTDLEQEAWKRDGASHFCMAYFTCDPALREEFSFTDFRYLLIPHHANQKKILDGLNEEEWLFFSKAKSLHASTYSSTYGAVLRMLDRTICSDVVRRREGDGLDWARINREKWTIVTAGHANVSRIATATVFKLRIAELLRFADRNVG